MNSTLQRPSRGFETRLLFKFFRSVVDGRHPAGAWRSVAGVKVGGDSPIIAPAPQGQPVAPELTDAEAKRAVGRVQAKTFFGLVRGAADILPRGATRAMGREAILLQATSLRADRP